MRACRDARLFTGLNLGRRQGTLAGFPYSISVPILYYNADR
ncbi:MAG: Glycerol-3-phosphate ABC transporter, periplasmic glycerol-3-phosphate-binding protein [Hydrogenibacillus schlegelii]|uniref:Glycerol-3-phosphate ABC transporter, periplasmic glycerol-3-phosphate-binding protein n=1 Tax=Hydrogenibacillus schlegelii TaxID=1484 RepID=A0A2T5G587_HYDSH|nr:MAG: Glycerol-3-phosphate ABC transporter, periplasmic glycerol-3-phosphate-binding protein [Hydrogenibacillus schlegelii]